MRKKVILSSLLALPVLFISSLAFAQTAGEVQTNLRISQNMWIVIAMTFPLAIAAAAGAMAQAKTASAALESIGRNPGAAGSIFTNMLLGLVLIESLVIYVLVIAFMLFGKLS